MDLAIVVFWLSAALIGYSSFGYALLSILLAKLPFRARGTFQRICGLPSVDLIIPAFNEGAILEAKINNALQPDYPTDKLQIIVVDDCSSDDTAQIIARKCHPRLQHMLNSQRSGKAAGITKAATKFHR